MGTDLVPVLPGRPTFIKLDGGCTVFISVHDQQFLERWRSYKRIFRELHPDMGTPATATRFRRARTEYEKWMAKEAKWYAQYSLEPPKHYKRLVTAGPKGERRELPGPINCAFCGKVFQQKFYGRTLDRLKCCNKHCGHMLSAANRMGLSPRQYMNERDEAQRYGLSIDQYRYELEKYGKVRPKHVAA